MEQFSFIMMAILLGALMVLGMSRLAARRLKLALEQQAQTVVQKYASAKVLHTSAGANFFGLKGSEPIRLHGNGVLLLTPEELIFEPMLGRRELKIRRSAIEAIETPISFMGKSQMKPLLLIRFKDQQGQSCEAAWWVPDLSQWESLLNSASDLNPSLN